MSRTSALRIEQPLSVEEYLAFERAADTKHEYDDGEIIAFAGASRKHNLVGGNTFRHLGNQLEGKPCEIYVTEMRVRVAPNERVVVTLWSTRRLVRSAMSSDAGAFTVNFGTVTFGHCTGFSLSAVGATGDRFVLKMPRPACMPQRDP